MRSDFILAINQLCAERKLPPEVVMEAVHAALVSAYKRNFGAATNIEVRLDPTTGEALVFAVKEVTDSVSDPKLQIELAEAKRVDSRAQIGQSIHIESTPRDFGRIAAQAAKQVILQRIREAEREALFSSFANSEGEIAHGTIQSIDFHTQDAVVNLDGAEALLPAKEQVPTERYRRGVRLRAYVLEVRKGSRGPHITLSRRTPLFLRRLLELEVPEIYNGTVEVKNIAREPGSRSKVAVHATQEGVDPVGSCVGVRGGRIQNVVNELGGEKIDVVQWSADPASYIGNALSPAKVMSVRLEDRGDGSKTATVIVPDRQLSLAIGKEGQNARLAAKLTGWRIDIKSATEAAEETLGRLKDRIIPVEQMDLLSLAEAILQKREAAGLTAEEEALIARDLERGGPDIIAWPEQPPQLEEAPTAPSVAAPAEPAVAPSAAVPRPEPEPQPAGPPVVQATRPPEAAPEAEPLAELEAEELAEPRPRKRAYDEEAEQVPTFEGEPVEESSGWVKTESQQELYTGWQADMEETLGQEEDWDREEEEEPGELPRAAKKRKKKKGGKSRYTQAAVPTEWS